MSAHVCYAADFSQRWEGPEVQLGCRLLGHLDSGFGRLSGWGVENAAGRYILWALFFLGWATVLVGTFLINHFDLFGLRQVYLYQRGKEYTDLGFGTPFLYKVVRHPIMLGFVMAFWATPRMTVGHVVFAVATTAYILVAIQLEERDIVSVHGTAYEEYRKQVSMLLPIPKRR